MKRFLSVLLVIIMVCSSAVAVNAAGDTQADFEFGSEYSGSINWTNQEDAYPFTISESGKVTIDFTAVGMESVKLYIYDENQNPVWQDNLRWNDGTEKEITLNRAFDLTSGAYTFRIEKHLGTGSYTFTAAYASANESFAETSGGQNNTLESADSVAVGSAYTVQLAENDDSDFYKFTLPESGKIAFSLTGDISRLYMDVYDADGDRFWITELHWRDGKMSFNWDFHLTSGVYYFGFRKTMSIGTGSFQFHTSFTSAEESFAETAGGVNNTPEQASPIALGTKYLGQIAENDAHDYYKFTVSETEKVKLDFTANYNMDSWCLYLYDADGNKVWYTDRSSGETTKPIRICRELDLTAGTYYFCVEGRWGKGNYNFILDEIKSYTVTFDGNGGTCPAASVVVINGGTYGELPQPEREGYTFAGWYTLPEGGNEVTSESVVDLTADQTLYAHWQENDDGDGSILDWITAHMSPLWLILMPILLATGIFWIWFI